MNGDRWVRLFTIYGVAVCVLFAYASYRGAALFDFLPRAHRGPGGYGSGIYHK